MPNRKHDKPIINYYCKPTNTCLTSLILKEQVLVPQVFKNPWSSILCVSSQFAIHRAFWPCCIHGRALLMNNVPYKCGGLEATCSEKLVARRPTISPVLPTKLETCRLYNSLCWGNTNVNCNKDYQYYLKLCLSYYSDCRIKYL